MKPPYRKRQPLRKPNEAAKLSMRKRRVRAKSEPWLFADKVYKGWAVLFTSDGTMIAGDCRFTAKKTQKRGGDAVFDITLIKQL